MEMNRHSMDAAGRVFDPSLADDTEKTFHVHKGLRMSWWFPQT
jgi:hypothetical protein